MFIKIDKTELNLTKMFLDCVLCYGIFKAIVMIKAQREIEFEEMRAENKRFKDVIKNLNKKKD